MFSVVFSGQQSVVFVHLHAEERVPDHLSIVSIYNNEFTISPRDGEVVADKVVVDLLVNGCSLTFGL